MVFKQQAAPTKGSCTELSYFGDLLRRELPCSGTLIPGGQRKSRTKEVQQDVEPVATTDGFKSDPDVEIIADDTNVTSHFLPP